MAKRDRSVDLARMGEFTVDLRQLRYFAKVAELKSFTAASRAIHVSQPSLGVQIKGLEDELGTSLLQRHSRGVELTDAGVIFLNHARDILDRVEAAQSAVRQLSGQQRQSLRVGLIPSLGLVLASDLLQAVGARMPALDLSFKVEMSELIDAALIAGDVDLSLSYHEIDDKKFQSTPLYLEKLYLMGTPELLRNVSEPISLRTAAKLPLALDKHSLFRRAAKEHNIVLSNATQVDSMLVRHELITKGERCVVGPYAFLKEEIQAGTIEHYQISEPALWCCLRVNRQKNTLNTCEDKKFIDLVIEIIGSHIQSDKYKWFDPALFEEKFSDIGQNYILY